MEISTSYTVGFLAGLFVIVNVASVIAVWWDKRRAVREQWRIREETLLVWALVGGWPGGVWAMRRFRHKTSKFSFIAKYVFVVILNIAGVAAIVLAVAN